MSTQSLTPSTPLLIGPEARPVTPLPRWTLAIMGMASLSSMLDHYVDSSVLGLLNALLIAASLVAGCSLAAWAEERVFVLVASKRLVTRALLLVCVPVLAITLALVLGLVLGWGLGLVHADDWVPGALILSCAWMAGAALGSLVILLIDSLVSALIRDFRSRLVLAILLLVVVVILSCVFISFAGYQALDTIRSGNWEGSLNVKWDGKNGAVAARELMEMLGGEPVLLAVLFFVLCALLALPTMMSTCGKLADAIMERIHPLGAAFDSVAQGERNVRLQEGGSTDFIRVARSFNQMVESLKLAERMERAFGLYVSSHVLERIRAQHGEALIPASLREASVFFADIRGFASMSEKLSPPQVVGVLNRYFERVVSIVEQHEGYLNKFIGDAVVVVFNGPIDQPDHAQRAVRCAIALQKVVAQLNEAGAFPEIGQLKIGVGVATGPMVCGNIGGSRQLEYTVIGDTVNLSSRLTSKAGPGEVIISEATAKALAPDLPSEPLEAITVKGKEKPVIPYRVWPAPGGTAQHASTGASVMNP